MLAETCTCETVHSVYNLQLHVVQHTCGNTTLCVLVLMGELLSTNSYAVILLPLHTVKLLGLVLQVIVYELRPYHATQQNKPISKSFQE